MGLTLRKVAHCRIPSAPRVGAIIETSRLILDPSSHCTLSRPEFPRIEPPFSDANDFHRTTPREKAGEWLQKMVDTIQPLCASKERCTAQAIQASLCMSGFIYTDITGGFLEHSAPDHTIEKLPNR